MFYWIEQLFYLGRTTAELGKEKLSKWFSKTVQVKRQICLFPPYVVKTTDLKTVLSGTSPPQRGVPPRGEGKLPPRSMCLWSKKPKYSIPNPVFCQVLRILRGPKKPGEALMWLEMFTVGYFRLLFERIDHLSRGGAGV